MTDQRSEARDEGKNEGIPIYISRSLVLSSPKKPSSLPAGGSTAPASSGRGSAEDAAAGFARPSCPSCPSSRVERGTWIVWRRDFADSKAGDLELTVRELAAVFVRLGLAEILETPPRGARGKGYIRKEDR